MNQRFAVYFVMIFLFGFITYDTLDHDPILVLYATAPAPAPAPEADEPEEPEPPVPEEGPAEVPRPELQAPEEGPAEEDLTAAEARVIDVCDISPAELEQLVDDAEEAASDAEEAASDAEEAAMGGDLDTAYDAADRAGESSSNAQKAAAEAANAEMMYEQCIRAASAAAASAEGVSYVSTAALAAQAAADEAMKSAGDAISAAEGVENNGASGIVPEAPATAVASVAAAMALSSETDIRDKIFNVTSSMTELEEIYALYDRLLSIQNVNADPAINSTTSVPFGSVNIYYASYPQTIDRERYAIIMFKFTNPSGQTISEPIEYEIQIVGDEPNNKFTIEKNGTTRMGSEIVVIDGNTFPHSLTANPAIFNIKILVKEIDDVLVNEVVPIRLGVYS